MAKINCCGDCTRCEHLRNGEVNPAECASIWGFMGIQKLHDNMVRMHGEIISAVEKLAHPPVDTRVIPGIEFEEIPTTEEPTTEEPTTEEPTV